MQIPRYCLALEIRITRRQTVCVITDPDGLVARTEKNVAAALAWLVEMEIYEFDIQHGDVTYRAWLEKHTGESPNNEGTHDVQSNRTPPKLRRPRSDR